MRSNCAAVTELLKYRTLAGINLTTGNPATLMLTDPVELNQYAFKLLVMTCIEGRNYLVFSKLVFKLRAGEA